MKTKGIPFWERHLEHMVLALAVLILVAFAAMQFVGSPNSIALPQGKQSEMVGPSTVDARLQEKASSLLQGMGPDAASPAKFEEVIPQAQKFADMKSALVSNGEPLPQFRPNMHPGDVGNVPPPGTPFVVAKVPAPTNVLREQYFDMILPEEVSEFPELKKLLGDEPYDATWLTASATFQAGDLLKQFKNRGPNGEASIPQSWFNDRVDFIDVKMEREELVDGKWTNSMLINHIPGQFDLRPTLAAAIDQGIRDNTLMQVNDPPIRTQIIQPEFYKTKNAAWSPPDKKTDVVANIDDPVLAEIASIKSQLADKTKRRNAIEAKMKANGCPIEAPPKPGKKGPEVASTGGKKPAAGPAAPGGGSSDVSSGGKGLGRGPGGTKSPVQNAACDSLRHTLETLNSQIANFELRLQKLQGDNADKQPEKVEEKPAEIGTPDQLTIWAHDLNIQAGKTYRYRFTVEVYNPLFANKIALIDSQKPLSEKFTLVSQTSEWSQPIEIQPWMRVFVTSARPSGGAGNSLGGQLAQATAEIFRYRDGRWWLDRFNVFVGDQVGQVREVREPQAKPAADAKAAGAPAGAKPAEKPADVQLASIDYRTDWFVLDVVEDLGADSADTRSGLGASVMLQSLTSPSVFIQRSPKNDSADPERRRLQDEVKNAESEMAVASASPNAPKPGGASGQ